MFGGSQLQRPHGRLDAQTPIDPATRVLAIGADAKNDVNQPIDMNQQFLMLGVDSLVAELLACIPCDVRHGTIRAAA
jgi:hypothetical protein